MIITFGIRVIGNQGITMEVLVTGAFGNIGESTIIALSKTHHDIRCFDLRRKNTEEKAESLSKDINMEVIWGDITDIDSVKNAIKNVECIIHLAAIIPPPSESNPDLARKVNVGGTGNVIEAAESMEHKPRLVFTSSISTHGYRGPESPTLTADAPQNPTDNYTHHKIECESMIHSRMYLEGILMHPSLMSHTIRELSSYIREMLVQHLLMLLMQIP
jgi:UDP-glucose 4-epimerase